MITDIKFHCNPTVWNELKIEFKNFGGPVHGRGGSNIWKILKISKITTVELWENYKYQVSLQSYGWKVH